MYVHYEVGSTSPISYSSLRLWGPGTRIKKAQSKQDKLADELGWIMFSWVEQAKVHKKLPNFAGVLFYSLNFEPFINFKAQKATINQLGTFQPNK